MKSKWLIVIEGDVHPRLYGPYIRQKHRDQKARDLREDDPNKENGIYKLDLFPRMETHGEYITIKLSPEITTYSGGFFDET